LTISSAAASESCRIAPAAELTGRIDLQLEPPVRVLRELVGPRQEKLLNRMVRRQEVRDLELDRLRAGGRDHVENGGRRDRRGQCKTFHAVLPGPDCIPLPVP
jgi:hypothetical protein